MNTSFLWVFVVNCRDHIVIFSFLGLHVNHPPLNESPGSSGSYLFKKLGVVHGLARVAE
jgi:hypothetical protein